MEIYALDDATLDHACCLLPPARAGDGEKVIRIGRKSGTGAGGGPSSFVCLVPKPSNLVLDEDMCVSPSVLDILGYSPGEKCSASWQELAGVAAALHLVYRGYRSHKHWDEFSTADLSEEPQSWMNHVPRGLSVATVADMLPLLLSQHAVSHGAILVATILSVDMMFEVSLPEPQSTDCFRVQPGATTVTVEWFPSALASSSTNNSRQASFCPPSELSYCRPAWTRLLARLSLPHPDLSSSFLLAGPRGAGKTCLLRALPQHCPPSTRVLYASVLDVSEGDAGLGKESEGDVPPAWDSLSTILSTAFSQDVRPSTVASYLSAYDKVVLVLDDTDALFSLYPGQENDLADQDEDGGGGGGEASRYSSQVPTCSRPEQEDALRILAHHLYVLLSALSSQRLLSADATHDDVQCQLSKLVVVGTTCVDSRTLPRAHMQCPEFATVLPLHKPSLSDRQVLWRQILSRLWGEDPSLPPSDWPVHLAALSRGYLPADLDAVVAYAQRLSLAQGDGKLAWSTLLQALTSYRLSSLRKVEVSLSHDLGEISWESWAGSPEVIAQVQRALRPLCAQEDAETHRQPRSSSARRLQRQVCRGMVLHGPSGCGKTFLGRIIARMLRMNLLAIRSTDLLSKYFGQTEAKVRSLFRTARQAAPCLLFLDDFDALAHRRGLAGESGQDDSSSHGSLQNRVLSTFLNELDGILSSRSSASSAEDESDGGGMGGGGSEDVVLVIVACKDVHDLDEALLRPGRLHEHVHLPIPSRADFTAILQRSLSVLPCEEEASSLADKLAEKLLNTKSAGLDMPPWTGATAQALCGLAQLQAVEQAVRQRERGESVTASISAEIFLQAVEALHGSSRKPEPPPSKLPAFDARSREGSEWTFNLGV